MPQPFRIKTDAFSASELLLESFSCSEGLGTLGETSVSLLSPRSDLDADRILGKPVTLEIELRGDAKRHLHGFVTRFAHTGATGRLQRYQAIVRPWLWFLTRTTDCRIFQDMTVPDILKTVFDDHPIAVHDARLFREYRTWDYCVQYRESDFDFVSRLMEHEGIYYRFDHADGEHKLILLDSASAHDPQPEGADDLPFFSAGQQPPPDLDFVSRWAMTRSVQPGKFAIKDFDFEAPGSDLLVDGEQPRRHDLSDFEVFDYRGVFDKKPDGVQYLENRRDETGSRFEVFSGATNAQSLRSGFTFTLRRHPRDDQNAQYLVTGVDMQASNGSVDAGQGGSAAFHCELKALRATQQFRPPRRTRKALMQGPQTAVVVGKEGEEIHTDKFGRVRVQFHWDRLGKKNEKSSCMVRVAQLWAGRNFGAMFIPRVGHEVIVDFLEGDPDQPIITGCVYNGDNMPPWKLPDHATQSGVLTRSTKGGAVGHANMIRFEDKKGGEQLAVHAERNLDTSVEADETHSVGHDRRKTIEHDETSEIKNNRSKTVGIDEKTTIGGNRTESVGKNEDIAVGVNRSEKVGASETVHIGANRSHTIGASDSHTVAVDHGLTVGASQTVTVGANRTDTVGGNVTQTIGGNLTQTAAGNVTLTTPGTMTVTATGGVTFIAPGGTKFIDFQFNKLGGLSSEKYGTKLDDFSVKTEITGLAITVRAINVSKVGLLNTKIDAHIQKCGWDYECLDGTILSTNVGIRKASTWLFT